MFIILQTFDNSSLPKGEENNVSHSSKTQMTVK